MNNVVTIPKPSDLENFIHFLFEGLEGYMYVVAKEPDNSESWDQVFFEYPEQVPVAIKAINTYSKSHEIYLAPALFNSKNALKNNVKVTQVLWCDFDGNTPKSFDVPPSYVIRSSEPGHEHVYWKLDTPLVSTDAIEDYNRRLCFKYGADNSGWDANQVLRPPYTINHKRSGVPVTALSSQEEDLCFNLAVFDDLAPAPEKTVDYSLWEKFDLPDLNDVIYRNQFGPEFRIAFEKGKAEVHDRSASLTHMAHICAEAGLNDKEIYVIIQHLADRWEKFKHHTPSSKARQLIGIIEHTRIKHPHSQFNDFDEVFEYSPKTLLETDIQIEWAIEGMLMSNGVMVMSGPGGIGKTSIAMQLMAHMAMGKDYWHYSIPEPKPVGFFSLEMGDLEVKSFLQSMYPVWEQTYGPEAISNLNKNLKIIPFGESLPLNTPQGQHILIQYIEDNPEWAGVFIDSIGSAILGNISSPDAIQPFTNFNDKIRKRYGIFLWYIHHFRKPAPGQKSYGGAEDNYGDVYIINRATSNYTVTKAKNGLLRIQNPKNRHAKTEDPFLIRRELGLTFSYQGVENEVPDVLGNIIEQVTTDKNDPANDNTPKPFSV